MGLLGQHFTTIAKKRFARKKTLKQALLFIDLQNDGFRGALFPLWHNCVTPAAISKAAETYSISILADRCVTVSKSIHLIALHTVFTRVPLVNAADADPGRQMRRLSATTAPAINRGHKREPAPDPPLPRLNLAFSQNSPLTHKMSLFDLLFPEQAQASHLRSLLRHKQLEAVRQRHDARVVASAHLENTGQRLAELETELARTKAELAETQIVTRALVELILQSTDLKSEDLQNLIEDIDARDGVIDGRVTPPDDRPKPKFVPKRSWRDQQQKPAP